MQTRIYKISNEAGEKFLVKASSQAQALRHIAGRHYNVSIAKASDVADMMSDGVKVETAKEGDAE